MRKTVSEQIQPGSSVNALLKTIFIFVIGGPANGEQYEAAEVSQPSVVQTI